MKAAFHFFQKFPIVFRFSSVIKQVLLIFSYFTTCPGGGSAGYVVVVAQGMWWRWRRICGGEIKKKIGLSWNWGKIEFLKKKLLVWGGQKFVSAVGGPTKFE